MCFDSISYSSNIYTNSKYYSMLYSLHSQASFVFWQIFLLIFVISCVVYALLVCGPCGLLYRLCLFVCSLFGLFTSLPGFLWMTSAFPLNKGLDFGAFYLVYPALGFFISAFITVAESLLKCQAETGNTLLLCMYRHDTTSETVNDLDICGTLLHSNVHTRKKKECIFVLWQYCFWKLSCQ